MLLSNLFRTALASKQLLLCRLQNDIHFKRLHAIDDKNET